jgi:glycosyltransferase involved in cell wall biosynthesis
MITGESLVYFGPEQWDSMWRNRHHLLSRLARANRVVYVEPRPYTYEVIGGLRRGELGLAGLRSGGMRQDRENLWVYRPLRYAPVGGPPPLRALTRRLRRAGLLRALAELKITDPLVWLSHPSQADVRLDLPARLRVYHIVDDYLGYYGLSDAQRASWIERENALIAWADLVIAVSAELVETKGAGNPKFRLLPNAVDDIAYSRPPTGDAPELAGLLRPILGYVGLISVRLDLALLDALAAAHPAWTLVLMCTVYREGCADDLDRLATRPNVHLLSPVPGDRVADYVRRFDVGLAPYKVTRETYHASPLKIYEYLAAGLPVVSADVPGSRQFGDAVAIGSAPAEWEAAITAALSARSPEAVARRREAVAPHTWDARVETLSEYLIEALARKEGGDTAR